MTMRIRGLWVGGLVALLAGEACKDAPAARIRDSGTASDAKSSEPIGPRATPGTNPLPEPDVLPIAGAQTLFVPNPVGASLSLVSLPVQESMASTGCAPGGGAAGSLALAPMITTVPMRVRALQLLSNAVDADEVLAIVEASTSSSGLQLQVVSGTGTRGARGMPKDLAAPGDRILVQPRPCAEASTGCFTALVYSKASSRADASLFAIESKGSIQLIGKLAASMPILDAQLLPGGRSVLVTAGSVEVFDADGAKQTTQGASDWPGGRTQLLAAGDGAMSAGGQLMAATYSEDGRQLFTMTTSASGTTLVQHGACSLPVASDLDASTDDDDAGDDAGAKPPTHEPPAIEAIALARDEAGVGAVYALSKNTLFRFDAQCANPRPIPLPSGEQYTRLFAVDGRVAVGADRALILGKLEAGAMRALVSVSLEQRLSDAKYLPKHDAWFVRHTGPTRGCSVLDARAAADGAAMRLLQDTTCSEPMDSVEAVLVTTAADATRKPALVRIDVRVGSNELELPGKVWASGLDAGASRVFAALASGDVSIVTLATWCSALTPAIDISAMAESMRPK